MSNQSAPTWQDKDQFEFAAKAAGYTKTAWVEDANGVERFHVFSDRSMWLEWNPRDDDGDAFRLAVLLRIDVEWCGDYEVCVGRQGPLYLHQEQDIFSATRRAIFRTAAEVGKAMQ